MTTFMNSVAKMTLIGAFMVLPAVSFAQVLPPVEGGDNGATIDATLQLTIDTTLPPMNGGQNGATEGTTTVDTGLPPIGGGDTGATTGTTTDTTTVVGTGGSLSFGGGSGALTTTATTSATTTSSVLIAPVTLNCPFLEAYVIPGKVNFLTDVAKVQLFMNTYTGTNVTVNGVLGADTIDAIKAFQTAHLTQVMGPWGANVASGQVYITTLKMINDIACGNTSALTPAELAIINAYKAGQNGTAAETQVSADASSTTPVIPTSSTTPSILNTNASLVGNAFSAVGGFFKSVFLKIGSWF